MIAGIQAIQEAAFARGAGYWPVFDGMTLSSRDIYMSDIARSGQGIIPGKEIIYAIMIRSDTFCLAGKRSDRNRGGHRVF
ncbi:MAG: hypothetical protein IPO72_16905 [Saprospiraceae bacterium]|nr:hypothetical protein [Candidatus Vicinibacter affinis]